MEAIADEPSYVTGVERTRWDGPLLRLVYSPAANVELDVEWVTRVGVAGEEGRGDIQSSEWGDVTLRAKWRIVEGKGRSPHDRGPLRRHPPADVVRGRRVQPARPRTEHPAGVRGGPAHPAGRPRAHPRQRRPLPPGRGVSPARPAGLPLLRPRLRVAGDVPPRCSSPRWRGGPATAGRAPTSAPRPAPACASAAAACGGTWRCAAAWRRRTARGALTLGLTWTARGPAGRP